MKEVAKLRITDCLNVKNYTLLGLEKEIPLIPYKKIQIEGVIYEPVIVYDAKDCIGIKAAGDFTGKKVSFLI